MSSPELAWFKSSYSGTEGDNCVEVAITEQAVSVRDSKDAKRPHLVFGRGEWGRFVEYAACG
ncbi:DUF397 domain-containing protein [Streptomyces varsoviensis]|uniref:Toxin-antitoxin system, toxin component n=1 Tax=Streptomyces varsoviensis TaxID=67373 RepID=A0ABR5J1X9_9ACTN|nr:DUF397 domain-containing protein [Streptomyces varsoviensis]KOG87415.1 toxin-antitoxin system, toxin component [Streptomyces varsoviensis]